MADNGEHGESKPVYVLSCLINTNAVVARAQSPLLGVVLCCTSILPEERVSNSSYWRVPECHV